MLMYLSVMEEGIAVIKKVLVIICNQNLLVRSFCIHVFICVEKLLEIQTFKLMKIKGLFLLFSY